LGLFLGKPRRRARDSSPRIGWVLGKADCLPLRGALQWRMPRDPFIREKFTKERTAARKHAKEYFQRFPKDRYQTEVESWRDLQSSISNSR